VVARAEIIAARRKLGDVVLLFERGNRDAAKMAEAALQKLGL